MAPDSKAATGSGAAAASSGRLRKRGSAASSALAKADEEPDSMPGEDEAMSPPAKRTRGARPRRPIIDSDTDATDVRNLVTSLLHNSSAPTHVILGCFQSSRTSVVAAKCCLDDQTLFSTCSLS